MLIRRVELFVTASIALVLAGCSSPARPIDREPRQAITPLVDDPTTTNDESNDQPIGHWGTITMCVGTTHNGRQYTLDVDLEGLEVQTIYFPKGGNVDFIGCELDDQLTGTCDDERGREWEFSGEC